MKLSIFAAAAALAGSAFGADGVKGAAEGFAKGVTGGGNAAPVYPSSTAQLIQYLSDSSPRVIVLTKTFDFTGTEGTATSDGCAPWGTGSQCQQAINKDNWCGNYQPNAPKVSGIKYDKAGVLGMTIGSNKSLIGQGNKGVIKGKGVRIVSNAKNVIIQNVRFTDINPKYVWGGDAITIDGADQVWIDHVTTDLIARQHIVLGNSASNRVTISNSEFNGATSWSATCNGRHYWGIYLTGSNDMVTFKNNYVHHTSGRSPKVGGNTLLHAVNNYFYAIEHAFEADSGSKILAEGNIFQNVDKAALGRACKANSYGSSGALTGTDSSILSGFSGKNVASAAAASTTKNLVNTAGYGRI
jgi:pectin lyase